MFEQTVLVLRAIPDTDEIRLTVEAASGGPPSPAADIPVWSQPLVGKKLQSIWQCDNSQGYRDQICFAFDTLAPTVAFVCEGSVLKVFCYRQVARRDANSVNRRGVVRSTIRLAE